MPIEFPCNSCGKTLRTPDDSTGKSARCPNCQAIVTIPGAPPPSSPFAEPPGIPKAETESVDDLNPYSSPQAISPWATGKVFDESAEIRNQRVDVGAVFNHAVQVWQDNLGLLVGVTVVIVAISYGIAIPLGIAQEVLLQNGEEEAALAVAILGNLAANLVQIYLSVGQAHIAVRVAQGQRAEFAELFAGRRFLPVLGFSILAGVALVAGALACVVPAILLLLFFWPSYYLVLEGKSQVFESFGLAQMITEGNIGATFLIWLLSVGIILLGVLALCIGVLFAAPLVSVMWATAYLMMSGQIPTASRRYT